MKYSKIEACIFEITEISDLECVIQEHKNYKAKNLKFMQETK